jgi:hypothetical protein
MRQARRSDRLPEFQVLALVERHVEAIRAGRCVDPQAQHLLGIMSRHSRQKHRVRWERVKGIEPSS